MDSADNLVEIAFRRCVTIPRMLIQVIGWSVPHHDFLSRLTIRWATLDAIALYEFSKFLSNVNLTEICLDDSPVKGRNYEVLLASPNSLRYLSLARCDLDDEDTARLATHLQYPRPAASSLAVLLLVANRVGDAGAAALADALRSNRTLRCLNLSGNVISDVGAISIFETLTEFPLTADEIIKKRLRFLEYLKLKSEVYDKCVRQLILERNHDEGRAMRRRPTLQAPQRRYSVKASQFSNALYQKAEALANELVGVFTDPFSVEQTVTRSDHTYCIGNTSLCWLNLSYNNLEYSSLGALYEALAHQQWLGPRAAPGLLRVNVDGNRLPVDCDQLFLIEDLLHRARCSKSRQIKHVVDKLRPGRVRSSS
ncbi:NLR family CARD domain-containing protein 3-like [Spodoptera litura]|uniref:NLR family CARD domain-containing protein 3-like n=1 Tax=Spodoptera litura TaxID=69820 RepID=A0A9J7DNG5_SPOLT|nr:NLR family CARD domain-containing protein 3-like [Spodoptera litura]